jgi:cell division protein FtsB
LAEKEGEKAQLVARIQQLEMTTTAYRNEINLLNGKNSTLRRDLDY